jgi:unsaturated chondroitin disaccharide hydrolase
LLQTDLVVDLMMMMRTCIMNNIALIVLMLITTIGGVAQAAPTPFDPKALLDFSAKQLLATSKQVTSVTQYPVATHSTPNGQWPWLTSAAGPWTCGFFPSSLWQMYNYSSDATWKTLAESWTAGISTQENNTGTHDVGFMVYYTFARGYELTGREDYKRIALQTAHSLSTRYSSIVGCIRSWNGEHFQVIVDNMLNLELLFWAAENGGPEAYKDMAIHHSDHTARNHIRKAGNSWHLVDYDPNTGAVLEQTNTPQGFNASNATWARGQGWAVYGFTMAYRYTKFQRYLETAQLCADWYIANLPSDYVPKWDFSVPDGSPRDTSAASITASGLLELAKYVDATTSQKYKQVAINTLASLASPAYLADPSNTPAILLHAVGSLPDNLEVDVAITYGDYYFIEALVRLINY